MQLQHIELSKLKDAAINMRHAKAAPDVSDILPSVKARGVLVPLLVRPNGDGESFEVVAGRRRYFAAKRAEEDGGEIDPLPCAIMEPGDDAAALEASMLENFARLDPDEMTQYETFVRLNTQGKTVEDIAATFGITEIMVRRRLALGELLPKIRGAYRKDAIDAATVRNLTMATKRQQRDWLKLFNSRTERAPRGQQLKHWLFGGQQIATTTAPTSATRFWRAAGPMSKSLRQDGDFALGTMRKPPRKTAGASTSPCPIAAKLKPMRVGSRARRR